MSVWRRVGLATALAPSAFRLTAVSGLRAKPCAAGVSARPPCQPVRPEGLSGDGHRLSRCSKPLRSAEAGREGRSRGTAQLTRSGTDLSNQQGTETAAWYALSMYNVVTQNRQNVHLVIKPDVDACRLDKGRSRACIAPGPRCGGGNRRLPDDRDSGRPFPMPKRSPASSRKGGSATAQPVPPPVHAIVCCRRA